MNFKPRWPIFNYLALFSLVFLILALSFCLSDSSIYSSDSINLNYVYRRWFFNSLYRDGSIPLTNPFLFGGIPNGADIITGVYSPLAFIFYSLFEGVNAFLINIAFYFSLGFIGIVLLLKDRVGFYLSIIAGLTYILSGFLISNLINYPYFASACLLPIFLYSFKQHTFHPSRGSLFFASLTFSLILLEGDLQNFLFAFLLSFILFIPSKERFKIYLIRSLTISVFGLLLSSLSWIPAFELFFESSRSNGLSYQEAIPFSFHPKRIIEFFYSGLFGFYANSSFNGNHLLVKDFPFSPRFWTDSLFVGIPFFGLFFSFFRFKNYIKEWSLLIFFLFLSFGDHFFLFKLLFNYFPFFDLFRFPSKYLVFVNFLIIFVSFSLVKEIKPKWGITLTAFNLVLMVILFPPLPMIQKKILNEWEQGDNISQFQGSLEGKTLWDGNIAVYNGNDSKFRLQYNWGMLHDFHYVFGYHPGISRGLKQSGGNTIFKNWDKFSKELKINYVLTTLKPRSDDIFDLFQKKKLTIEKSIPERNLLILKNVSPYSIPKRIETRTQSLRTLSWVLFSIGLGLVLILESNFLKNRGQH